MGYFNAKVVGQTNTSERATWRSPDGNNTNEIDNTMTDKPSMVADVTVINRVNIGSDQRMVMGCVTLNTRAERSKLLNKNAHKRVDTQMIGTNKNMFQLELKHSFTALAERDDIDSLNKNMTEMIQQNAMSIAKQTKKPKKPQISSPTRALMKKRREMIEDKTPRDQLEYVEICKTITKENYGRHPQAQPR